MVGRQVVNDLLGLGFVHSEEQPLWVRVQPLVASVYVQRPLALAVAVGRTKGNVRVLPDRRNALGGQERVELAQRLHPGIAVCLLVGQTVVQDETRVDAERVPRPLGLQVCSRRILVGPLQRGQTDFVYVGAVVQ